MRNKNLFNLGNGKAKKYAKAVMRATLRLGNLALSVKVGKSVGETYYDITGDSLTSAVIGTAVGGSTYAGLETVEDALFDLGEDASNLIVTAKEKLVGCEDHEDLDYDDEDDDFFEEDFYELEDTPEEDAPEEDTPEEDVSKETKDAAKESVEDSAES